MPKVSQNERGTNTRRLSPEARAPLCHRKKHQYIMTERRLPKLQAEVIRTQHWASTGLTGMGGTIFLHCSRWQSATLARREKRPALCSFTRSVTPTPIVFYHRIRSPAGLSEKSSPCWDMKALRPRKDTAAYPLLEYTMYYTDMLHGTRLLLSVRSVGVKGSQKTYRWTRFIPLAGSVLAAAR